MGDRNANVKLIKLKVYEPETTGGLDLMKLFKNGFILNLKSSKNETELRCKLQ